MVFIRSLILHQIKKRWVTRFISGWLGSHSSQAAPIYWLIEETLRCNRPSISASFTCLFSSNPGYTVNSVWTPFHETHLYFKTSHNKLKHYYKDCWRWQQYEYICFGSCHIFDLSIHVYIAIRLKWHINHQNQCDEYQNINHSTKQQEE